MAFPLLTVAGHARRSRVVTPLRVKKAGRRITPSGCFTAVLLGLALVYGAGTADAADGRHTRAHATRLHRIVLPARGDVVERRELIVERRGPPAAPGGGGERRELIVERRGPQVASGGTVVLRGSRSPVTPNTLPSGSNLNGAGYG